MIAVEDVVRGLRPATARRQLGHMTQRLLVGGGPGERGGQQLTAETRHLAPRGTARRRKSVADAMNMVDYLRSQLLCSCQTFAGSTLRPRFLRG